MKKILFLFAVLFVSVAFRDQPVNIYMVGDSTMADKAPQKYPITGWAQVFGRYFGSGAIVKNKALDGRTTRSFRQEGHWQPIIDSLKEGDYVFIEFGHNDEKIDLPKIGVPVEDFKKNLIQYVRESRAKKAIPVLLTPIMRRSFENGVFHDTHGVYGDAVRQVAQEEHVPLIDLQHKTEKLVVGYGEEGSKKLFNWVDSAATPAYPKGSKDNTHLSMTGAIKVAELAVEGIKEQKLGLADLLKK